MNRTKCGGIEKLSDSTLKILVVIKVTFLMPYSFVEQNSCPKCMDNSLRIPVKENMTKELYGNKGDGDG